MEQTAAVLIRRRAWSETSWITTWLTRDHGKISTVAKGARRIGSSFAGRLDLFFIAEISFSLSKKSALHSLREVRVLEPFDASAVAYGAVFLCGYFAEVTDLVTEPGAPVPELFDLHCRALAHLRSQPASRRALEHFEKELASLLGIADNLRSPIDAIAAYCGRIPASRQTALNSLKA